MEQNDHRRHLIRILQNAYSGEQAAALAYRGHWRSLKVNAEREAVHRIEEEEWEHRRDVGIMLAEMGGRPRTGAEIRTSVIGNVLRLACGVVGWFLPMYFAGRLEEGNAEEYDVAAAHADALGLDDYARRLRIMADVERDHEVFFHSMVSGHRMLPFMRRLFGWG